MAARDLYNILAVSLIAAILRIVNLENFPMWYCDEGTNITLGLNMLHGQYGYVTWGPNFFAPLYDALLGFAVMLPGEIYFNARLVGVILGVLSCILVYSIGKQLYGRSAGLTSAILLSVSSILFNRMAMQENGVEFFFLLSIYFYLKLRNSDRKRWSYLAGTSSGLAFLSNYTGLVAPIFLVLQSLIDRKITKIKNSICAIIILSMIYPIIGFLDWNGFIFDTLYQGSHALSVGHLFWALFESQPPLLYVSPVISIYQYLANYVNIWRLLGFAVIFYIALRGRENNSVLFTALVSALIIFVLGGDALWWVHLIIIFPFYCLAIAVTLYDLWHKRWSVHIGANKLILSIIPFTILAVSLFAIIFNVDSSWDVKNIYFGILLLVVLLVLLKAYLHPKVSVSHGFSRWSHAAHKLLATRSLNATMCLLLILILGVAAFPEIKSVTSNATDDQNMVVKYLNSNTSENDLVAANPSFLPLLKSEGIDYFHVAFYTTKLPLFLYENVDFLYSRFKMDANLFRFKYIILDSQWFIEGGPRDAIDATTVIIYNCFTEVFAVGNYSIYENPFYREYVSSHYSYAFVEAADTTRVQRIGWWDNYTILGGILYGNTMVLTKAEGQKLIFNFSGRFISPLVLDGPDGGIMGMIIDGQVCDNVDLYSPTYTRPEVVKPTVDGKLLVLSNGSHTIEIIATGNKNSSSTDYFVRVNAFLVLS